MELASSCYMEKLVEDIHAIFLFLCARNMSVQCLWRGCGRCTREKFCEGFPYLVAWEHVNALSITVIQAPILFVIGRVASHGRRLIVKVGTKRQRYMSVWLSMNEGQADRIEK